LARLSWRVEFSGIGIVRLFAALEYAAVRSQDRLKVLQRVGFCRWLVQTPPQNAREAHRDAGFVAVRSGDAFVRELENLRRLNLTHRAELLHRVRSDPAIKLCDLFVAEP
jgi:hypothetical protein